MNVNTITMEPHVARRAFLEYRAAVRQRHDAEDQAIMRGYRELARGRQVLQLDQVLREAGVDEKGRPRLAVCAADQRTAWCRIDFNGKTSFYWGKACDRWNDIRWRASRSIIKCQIPGADRTVHTKLRAVVPSIPPQLRPHDDLSRYHILWEADWVQVPVDPMLLRHIGGQLYVVLASWDLTPLERAVLAGTRAQ